MIEIVGIGPFVVSSLVIKAMGGPQALIAWLAGALLATLDGFVWAELGAAMPRAGGTYVFLREAYGPQKWGRLMSFLFVWQTLIQAPLSVASAAIGFSEYAKFIYPFNWWQAKAIAGSLVVVLVISAVSPDHDDREDFRVVVGGRGGHDAVAHLGRCATLRCENRVRFPPGRIPLFVDLVCGSWRGDGQHDLQLFWLLQYLPFRRRNPRPRKKYSAGHFSFYSWNHDSISSNADQHSWRGALARGPEFSVSGEPVRGAFVRPRGPRASSPLMVLWIAMASVFSVLLGYSRVPYSAALDGNFLPVFARVHPTKHFPHVSLLFFGEHCPSRSA